MLKFPNAAELKRQVSAARTDCLDHLRREPETRHLWLVSRGACVRYTDKHGEPNGCDEWPFTGTAAEFKRLQDLANEPGTHAVYIEGGFNAAESGRDYADGIYDPWVGEWSVAVYVKEDA